MEGTQTDIFAIGGEIETYLAVEWRSMLDEHSDKLADAWERAGEMAYGTYLDLLYRPVHRWLKESGLRALPKLPGTFDLSREWGDAPDETDQQRWMWSTIETMEGVPVGTIVTITPHDHTCFRIPRAPGVIALAETGTHAVVDALSGRSPEFAAAREASIEIAEYMASLES